MKMTKATLYNGKLFAVNPNHIAALLPPRSEDESHQSRIYTCTGLVYLILGTMEDILKQIESD